LLQFGSWHYLPTGTARFCQVDKNLSASEVLTVESVCMPQNCLRVLIIMGRAVVVPGWWGGWLEIASGEFFSRGLSLMFSGGRDADGI
jgi:hypothetical protein